MKKILIPFLVFSLLITVAACGKNASSGKKDEGVVTITAQTTSPETTRVDNLVKAAEKLNEELKDQGKNLQVKIKTNVFDGSTDDYAKQFMLAFKAGKEPDIYATGHENIGWLADGGYILKLNDLKDSDAYSDLIPVLWDAVTYKGDIWAAPQDIESRPVYYNKDLLRQLGWSDEEIGSLPERVKKGEFTIDDMTRVAEEAQKKGIVQYGIIHRPVEGMDFLAQIYLFGGQLYDDSEGKLVFDREAIRKALNYFSEIAEKGLIPDNLTQMEWANIHRTVVNGKTLFYYGGLWNVFNWAEDEFHDKLGKVTPEWVDEHLGMMLIPAAEKGGKPVTLSHPYVYTVSSKTEHPELVKRLLELVADPDLQAEHSLKTAHLPITEKGAEQSDIKNDITLGKATYMLDYTTFVPNHKDFPAFSKRYFEAIQAVELGEKTVDEALKDMETLVKNDIGDQIMFKDE
jgi:Bacterial extracellular solute-binding protein.